LAAATTIDKQAITIPQALNTSPQNQIKPLKKKYSNPFFRTTTPQNQTPSQGHNVNNNSHLDPSDLNPNPSQRDSSETSSQLGPGRRVVFAEPTYVDHPGKTWSDTSGSEEDDRVGDDEDEMEEDERERSGSVDDVDDGVYEQEDSEDDFGTEEDTGPHYQSNLGNGNGLGLGHGQDHLHPAGNGAVVRGGTPDRYEDAPGNSPNPGLAYGQAPVLLGKAIDLDEMEPDDGIEWEDEALRLKRERDSRQAQTQGQGRNRSGSIAVNPPSLAPGPTQALRPGQYESQKQSMGQPQSSPREHLMDPAELSADEGTKRITVTPPVAQGNGGSPDVRANGHGYHGQPVLGQGNGQLQQQLRPEPLQQQGYFGNGLAPRDARSGPLVQQNQMQNQHDPQRQLQPQHPQSMQQQPRPRDISGASSFSINTQNSIRSMSTSPESGYEDEFGRRVGRKDKDKNGKAADEGSIVKKKRSGVFSGLFGKKKDKLKKAERDESTSFESERQSYDQSNRLQESPEIRTNSSLGPNGTPRTRGPAVETGSDSLQGKPTFPHQRAPDSPNAVSPQGIRLQQMDQKQQMLYQQYMARSPGNSPIDASRAYGTQAAATVAQSSAAQRLARATGSFTGRPGSIILNPSNLNGGPLLNVVRTFSGEHLDSAFTFKTVLLNETTTSRDLVKQALQRFRVDTMRDSDLDKYFLTIKEIGGEELALQPDQRPLEAFNEMCERIGEEQNATTKTVKRSSVGSISSISSNLSLHPAIAKLSNDFSDDSNVKLYLNRHVPNDRNSSYFEQYGPDGFNNGSRLRAEENGPNGIARGNKPSPITTGHPTAPTTINSPSARFALQVYLEVGDLPDGMGFDAQSEAIVPRPAAGPVHSRKKHLLVARGSTVAEAIEAALERFGISEGVVDGGDEVEDKVSKRKSMLRVRYGLGVKKFHAEGKSPLINCHPASTEPYASIERLLHASSKLVDAYELPPRFKLADKTITDRRRSREWARDLSANDDDIQSGDPIFFLRRVGQRTAAIHGEDKHPMDEVALKQRRLSDAAQHALDVTDEVKTPQQIIAEQRAASKAKQTAILRTQENADQGIDVVVADKGIVRSSRSSVAGYDEVRYSYISEDGETFDISQYVHDEWADVEEDNESKMETLKSPAFDRTQTDQTVYRTAPSTPDEVPPMLTDSSRFSTTSAGGQSDLLHNIVQKSENGAGKEYIAEKIDRVINKVISDRLPVKPLTPVQYPPLGLSQALESIPEDRIRDQRSLSPASDAYGSTLRDTAMSPQLEPIPPALRQAVEETPSRSGSRQTMHSPSLEGGYRSITPAMRTPVQIPPRTAGVSRHQRAQPSIASILSDVSASGPAKPGPTSLATMTGGNMTLRHPTEPINRSWPKPKQPIHHKDDFGFGSMMAVIRARAERARPPRPKQPELDPIIGRWLGPDMRPAINRLPAHARQEFVTQAKQVEALERETLDLMKRVVNLHIQERKKKEAQEAARKQKEAEAAENEDAAEP
jgi:hypothetical protein